MVKGLALILRFCSVLWALLVLLTLPGCLDVAHPFAHRGGNSQRLTQKNLPPPRLAVPVPVAAKAPWRSATALWAKDVVVALVAQSLPAVAQPPRQGDWWLRLGAKRVKNGVKPRYLLYDPEGKVRAKGYGSVIDRAGWLAADPVALNTVALEIAPDIARLLTGIQVKIMQADPHSLMNRPAKVYFAGVEGAPGDGNISLARAFYASLPDGRNNVQTKPEDADYTVKCRVQLKDLPPGPSQKKASEQQITIIWRVTDSKGKEAGAATQLHAIAIHSLDGAWGDIAATAAHEAAGAVRTIITNYSGRDLKMSQKK
ncbi:hypothetical protein GT348_08185 [Aristophania vespae]|uniref:DUF3313 family protein n=1 Tax=Aristophania vespae TaxID=2697033 RepID=A0A6P1NIT9_9PROT|nr:hypothetical protein GT348_08185 [Aristophania vespae]